MSNGPFFFLFDTHFILARIKQLKYVKYKTLKQFVVIDWKTLADLGIFTIYNYF